MRFRRALETKAEVNLVPMIDVVFQLILFFMVATTLSIGPGISVLLPDTVNSQQVAVDRLMVTIVSENEVYLNKDRYDLAGLDSALAGIEKADKESMKSVLVEADKTTSYDLMVKVLGILGKNGFKGVNLKTRVIAQEVP
jgi:biopolymer transport protein ExbD